MVMIYAVIIRPIYSRIWDSSCRKNAGDISDSSEIKNRFIKNKFNDGTAMEKTDPIIVIFNIWYIKN